MPNQSRRVVIKNVALAVPVAWSAPLVESVVLPVHAQTSAPVTNSEEACDSLVISGTTRTCPGDDTTEQIVLNHTVDDTGDCPVLNSSSISGPLPDSNSDLASDVLQIQVLINNPEDIFIMRINVWTTTGTSTGVHDCETTNDAADVLVTFEAASGAVWQAAGTITGNPDGTLVLSDLVLTPQ